MKRFQQQGHKPFILVGGATGMIGDPSGKSQERQLLDGETLQSNVEAIKKQLSQLLNMNDGENKAVLVNNHDWIGKFSFIEFLRDVGKRFRLSEMLAKDSVKSRLHSEVGISFTEFTYQMIQAYDFRYLNRHHQVTFQLGGADQWGNITAGIDLTRKMNSTEVFGLVIPLVTDAQGNKFGKSVGGTAIYLDPEMTSPYQMYQYLLNVDDETVIKLLNFYSFKSLEEINFLKEKMQTEAHLRLAQKALAEELVTVVHGAHELEKAKKATSIFFGEKIQGLSDLELAQIFYDVPSITLQKSTLDEGLSILDLLSATPLFESKGDARRAITQKGAYLNNDLQLVDPNLMITTLHLASESYLVIRKGKKNYCAVKFI